MLKCCGCQEVSYVRGRRQIGLGSIIRDAGGRVMACSSLVCEANFDLKNAKAMVMCKGLTYSKDCGLKNCVVEMDSKSVVKYKVNEGHSNSRYGSILGSITVLVSASRNDVFKCVSKKAKMVARVLANEAMGILEEVFWMKDAPTFIRSLVEDEQMD
ncbi:hypothetical protein Ddye_024378 [Dipteronia dyeriana]|uniref:RNase H type-1 domain-containing protein n=1 Tax=Dipteronia dyeriana TaxID=168575 RepID=A0AAD9WUD9_9ROSI|nr:hypothetical protein Ddye_024378 [Dipteronia dyeriana]